MIATSLGTARPAACSADKAPIAIRSDATKTASGLIYKKLVTSDAGAAPKRNDTVVINYTEWKQSTGETFYTTKSRGQGTCTAVPPCTATSVS